MQPLSSFRRRMYLATFATLFVVCIPVAILFASGYRLTSAGFVPTGGIFISAPYGDARVYMNGELVGTSGLLRRSFYMDSLSAGTYEVRVEREGSLSWYRTLIVEPEVVTDAAVFLVPEDIAVIPIVVGTTTSTTTRNVTRAQFNAYRAVFDAPAATSTRRTEGEGVFIDNGDVFVRLTDEGALPTSNYCIAPSTCAREISIETSRQFTTNAFYLGTNIVYTTREGGVFLSEVDIRPTALVVPLYATRGAEARLIDGQLVIKQGDELFGIEGL